MEVKIKLKKLHKAQLQIISEAKRFNVLKCGRRFGKSELTKDLTVNAMLDGKSVGYWTPTYKDLHNIWIELKFLLIDLIASTNEQVKQITLITGGKLEMWSLEDPNSGRGRAYHIAIIDEAEKTRNLKNGWEQTIRATLVDYEGTAWFMSTPKFGETYFKTVLFENEKKYPDTWKSWRFTTFDNPFINRAEIEEAQRYDDIVFRCEYLAEDVDVTESPFATQFNELKHVSDTPFYDYKKQLIISIDFNLEPFCVTFHHHWQDATGDHFHTFDEGDIKHGSIPAMIDFIKSRYLHSLPNAIITGDAMGKNRDLSQRDNASFYIQLLRGLGMRDSQLKVAGNPTHENSRADCNYFLYHFPDYKIHTNCKGLIRDIRNVQVDSFGAIMKKNRTDVNQRADYIDAGLRYTVHNILFRWIENHQRKK